MTAHQKCPWNRFAHPSPDVDCNYLCPSVIHLSFVFQTRQFKNSLCFLHLSDLPKQVILAGRLDRKKVRINLVHKIHANSCEKRSRPWSSRANARRGPAL